MFWSGLRIAATAATAGRRRTARPGRQERVKLRGLRGGSWFSTPQALRAAYRAGDYPDNRSFSVGFRVARTLD